MAQYSLIITQEVEEIKEHHKGKGVATITEVLKFGDQEVDKKVVFADTVREAYIKAHELLDATIADMIFTNELMETL